MTAPPAWPYPKWIAHRGAGKLAPENTLAAFRLGAAHGWRMFECDVKLTMDDVPFLLHDATLARTTDATRRGLAPDTIAGTRRWDELSSLDAGSWHSPAFAGERLPSLDAVADFCLAGGYDLNIEIKPTPGEEVRTGDIVARHAARRWTGARTPPLLSSFRPEALAAARAASPDLPRGLLLDTPWEGWFDVARRLGCGAIVCNHPLWTHETVAEVHRAGMKCLSYTVNDTVAAERLEALGTDGVITDRIDAFGPAEFGRL